MKLKKQILASQIAVKRSQKNEEQLQQELSQFFRKLKTEVLKALHEYWSDYQMLQGHINLICSPIHEAHREYYEILEKYIKKEYKLGQAEAKRLVDKTNRKNKYAFKEIKTMPITGFIKRDNDLFATIPAAERDLLNRTFVASDNTMNRVDGQINQIITDGYRSGQGINSVANDITRRFDQLQTWEAKRIARTEINNSHNTATMDIYADMNVEYVQWSAAGDDRTRDSHVEVDGEIVPLGASFSNGLGFPGDTSGPIEEWINCRCSVAPFVIPYGFIAPSFSPFRESDLVSIERPDYSDLLEQATEEAQEKIPTEDMMSSIPPEVTQKLDSFSNEYLNSRQEHMQFVTTTASSEVTHGRNAEVQRSRSQEEFMKKQTEKGEEIHAIHTHPNQHDMYTMLSHEDIIDAFIPWQSDGNLKSFSAENERNRVSIVKLRDDFLKIKKPSEVSNMITLDAHSAVNKAWAHYKDALTEVRNAPDEELLWRRQRKQELREQGLSSPEMFKIIDKEAETKKFKTLEEVQDEMYPKLVSDMNDILTPFGLKLEVKYKDKH